MGPVDPLQAQPFISMERIDNREGENPLVHQANSLVGKTVYEAIKITGNIPDDNFQITKLKGKFPRDDLNQYAVIADSYKIDGKQYFKFDVEWEVEVADHAPIKFTQEIFTSVKIPADPQDLEHAKKKAYQLAKSYELIQKNLVVLKRPANLSDEVYNGQVSALKRESQISFQKDLSQVVNNPSQNRISDMLAYSSESKTPLYLTKEKTNKVTLEVFSRIEGMSNQKIILKGESINPPIEQLEERELEVDSRAEDLMAMFVGTAPNIHKSRQNVVPENRPNEPQKTVKENETIIELEPLSNKKPTKLVEIEIELVDEQKIEGSEEKGDSIILKESEGNIEEDEKNAEELKKLILAQELKSDNEQNVISENLPNESQEVIKKNEVVIELVSDIQSLDDVKAKDSPSWIPFADTIFDEIEQEDLENAKKAEDWQKLILAEKLKSESKQKELIDEVKLKDSGASGEMELEATKKAEDLEELKRKLEEERIQFYRDNL